MIACLDSLSITPSDAFEVAKLATAVVAFWGVMRTLESNAQGKLYDQYVKFQELLLANPSLRPYFYEGQLPTGLSADDRGKVDALCEVIAAILELASLQKKNLAWHSWDQCWREYTRERIEKGPFLYAFILRHKHMYAQKFFDFVEYTELNARLINGPARIAAASAALHALST